VDAVKKIIMREAYFIEEEKKYLKQEGPKAQSNKHSFESFSVEEDERRKAVLLRQNLELELELKSELNQQLSFEIAKAQEENKRLIELEEKLNQGRLQMLLKFDRIKVLEEFYN